MLISLTEKQGTMMDDDQEIQIPLPLEEPKHRQAPALKTRCKNCIHFATHRAEKFKSVCSFLGVKPESRPCPSFFANPFEFKPKQKEFKAFQDLVQDLPKSKITALLGWLQQELITRSSGMEFGEVVYLRTVGDDYLRNYSKAVVISANRKYVFLQGAKKKFTAMVLRSSVLNEKQWKAKRASLISKNKIRDPKAHTIYVQQASTKRSKDYEVPTIDDFAKILQAKARRVGEGK